MVKSVRTKLLLSHFGVVFLLALAFSGFGFLSMKAELEAAQRSRLEMVALHAVGQVIGALDARKGLLERIAEAREVEEFSRKFQVPMLTGYLARFRKEFPVMSYFNPDGYEEVRVVNGDPAQEYVYYYSQSPAIIDAILAALRHYNQAVLAPVVVSAELGTPVVPMALAKKRYFGDRIVGVLVGAAPLVQILAPLSTIRIGQTGSVCLIDRQGQVLAAPNPQQAFKEIPGEGQEAETLIALAKAMKTGFGRATLFGVDGLVAYAPVEAMGWSVLVILPYEEFLSGPNRLRNAILVIFGMVCALGGVVAYLLAAGITRPLAELSAAAKAIGRGDLRPVEGVDREDEVGGLAASFNAMTHDLQKTTVSRDYLDNIIHSMNDSLVVVAPDGTIQTVNEKTCEMLGYARDELLNRPADTILLGEADARGPLFDCLIESRGGQAEKTYLAKDGRRIPVSFSSASLGAEAGVVRGIVCVAQDITERKRAEQTLRELAEKLQRSNRELQDFIFIASHDLQEPLRKVIAFGDRLKAKCSEALDDQGRDYLERMQNAAVWMQTLVDDLRSFLRVTTKVQPLVPVDLSRVAQEVLSDLEVRGRVEVGELPTIDADPLQMRQLLQNLIGNALKFRREVVPPLVRVYGEGDDGGPAERRFCRFVVEDNGIGFEEKYAERIFGVFQRLHGRGAYEGSGMGLAVCKKIAQRHGGSITAQSQPGQGATFVVTLPVHQPNEGVDSLTAGQREWDIQ